MSRLQLAGFPTRGDLWFDSFNAALHRVPPKEAIAEADEALRLCDARWRNLEHLPGFDNAHDYRVGGIGSKVTPRSANEN